MLLAMIHRFLTSRLFVTQSVSARPLAYRQRNSQADAVPGSPTSGSTRRGSRTLEATSRDGFTLVELLVVITIIGILMSLLLPAVQQIRAAARRLQCGNNLKQIGLALLNYETTIKKFPPGAFWYYDPARRKLQGSMFVHLLPYVESTTVYDQFDFTQDSIENQLIEGTNQRISSVVIPVYVCPSDDHGGTDPNTERAYHNYSGSSGPTAHITSPNCSCPLWQNMNALATQPYERPPQVAGVFHRRGFSIRMQQIRDGTSNTIAIGETRPGCSAHHDNGWVISNNGSGLTSTLIPINYDSCQPDSSDGCRRPCNWASELGFRSAHSGGAQFVFCDGSVHFLTEGIDLPLYNNLGDKADGIPVSIPQ